MNARYENGWYYCWLIEDRHGKQPVWWTGGGWTTVANDAIWFARHCDAENITMLWMHFGFPKDVVICEHGFMLEKPAEPAPPPKTQGKCGYSSFRNHTCALPIGHDGEHNSRADGKGSTWGTDPDDMPLPGTARAPAAEQKHERRVVQHVTGRQEYMDTCVCGKPWPCSDAVAVCESCGGTTGFVTRDGVIDVCDDPLHEKAAQPAAEREGDHEAIRLATFELGSLADEPYVKPERRAKLLRAIELLGGNRE